MSFIWGSFWLGAAGFWGGGGSGGVAGKNDPEGNGGRGTRRARSGLRPPGRTRRAGFLDAAVAGHCRRAGREAADAAAAFVPDGDDLTTEGPRGGA